MAVPRRSIRDVSQLAREAQAAEARVPGMYLLDGRMHVRRFAPVNPGVLQCRYGHRMKVRGRPLASTPQCEARDSQRRRCTAHVYLYRLSPLHYLALDITHEEADLLHRERMLDLDDVIAHFGLEMPPIR